MDNKISVFKQYNTDRIESPEKLDRYIRTSNPSLWIIVIALLILSVSIMVWGFVGTLPKIYTAEGITRGGKSVYCYIPTTDASRSMIGCDVTITLPDGSTVDGKVSDISSVPYSANEMYAEIPKEWIVYQFFGEDGEYHMNVYMYKLEVETEEDIPEDCIVEASIITENVKPIVYLLN